MRDGQLNNAGSSNVKRYRITIEERVDSTVPEIKRWIHRLPKYYLVDRLIVDTDKNIIAKVAELAGGNNESQNSSKKAK